MRSFHLCLYDSEGYVIGQADAKRPNVKVHARFPTSTPLQLATNHKSLESSELHTFEADHEHLNPYGLRSISKRSRRWRMSGMAGAQGFDSLLDYLVEQVALQGDEGK